MLPPRWLRSHCARFFRSTKVIFFRRVIGPAKPEYVRKLHARKPGDPEIGRLFIQHTGRGRRKAERPAELVEKGLRPRGILSK